MGFVLLLLLNNDGLLFIQEGFSTTPDDEERKPPTDDVPKGDAANDPTNVTHDHLHTLSKPSAVRERFIFCIY